MVAKGCFLSRHGSKYGFIRSDKLIDISFGNEVKVADDPAAVFILPIIR
jgi:hypothetical protein